MTDDDFKKHKLSHHLRAVNSVVDEAMPHVERIEALVQENPDFFGAAAGQLKIKAAADFLEALVEDYVGQRIQLGEGATHRVVGRRDGRVGLGRRRHRPMQLTDDTTRRLRTALEVTTQELEWLYEALYEEEDVPRATLEPWRCAIKNAKEAMQLTDRQTRETTRRKELDPGRDEDSQ